MARWRSRGPSASTWAGGGVLPVRLGNALIGVGGATTEIPVDGIFLENGVWTTGTAVIQFTTTTTTTILVLGQTFSMANTGIPTTATAMGSASGSLLTGGRLTLVTPTYVLSLGNEPPTFSSLTVVSQIPEPGTLLLLGIGVAGLAMLARGAAR